MTDAELDELLMNAKPLEHGGKFAWFETGFPQPNEKCFIHTSVFEFLTGDVLNFTTESEAFAALNAAVAKYKENRI